MTDPRTIEQCRQLLMTAFASGVMDAIDARNGIKYVTDADFESMATLLESMLHADAETLRGLERLLVGRSHLQLYIGTSRDLLPEYRLITNDGLSRGPTLSAAVAAAVAETQAQPGRCPICGGTVFVDPLPLTVGRRCVKCCDVSDLKAKGA